MATRCSHASTIRMEPFSNLSSPTRARGGAGRVRQMFKTRLTDLFGIEYPIVSAGMGGLALAELAAAVSNAGGLGTIALAGFTQEAIQNEIASARKLTDKPLLVNLLVPFLRPGLIETVM